MRITMIQSIAFVFVFSFAAVSNLLGQAPILKIPADYRLIYSQDFEDELWQKEFVVTDPEAWRWGRILGESIDGIDESTNRTLELFSKSRYKPPHRSPLNMAYIRDFVVGDFVLDISLLQTGREYGHRDMCLFFGFQDPAHFYYVHLATKADDHAHNIFIVNGAPRSKISKTTTKGVDWGTKQWHRIRLIRSVSTGLIQVFFDDMKKPIMEAVDQTFGAGHLGFGSFDDTGMMDEISLWAPSFEVQTISKFKAIAVKNSPQSKKESPQKKTD